MINSFYDPVAYSAKTVNVNAPERLMTNIFKTYTSYFKKVAANYNLITYYIQGLLAQKHYRMNFIIIPNYIGL